MSSAIACREDLRTPAPTRSHSVALESAVFALFGLLLAFTFSGAMDRYDAHRALITRETNAVGTAYLRVDLLPPEAQPASRQHFREYTRSAPIASKASPAPRKLTRSTGRAPACKE